MDEYKNRPIKYVEIGTFYGANLLAVAESYGADPRSKLYCIDPWEDYEEYPEYKGEQDKIYNRFLKNIFVFPKLGYFLFKFRKVSLFIFWV